MNLLKKLEYRLKPGNDGIRALNFQLKEYSQEIKKNLQKAINKAVQELTNSDKKEIKC